jgi:hypothetical protein
MGEVGVAGREHDFRVAREIKAARPLAVVGDRHPSQLHIVFRRHDDFGPYLDLPVDAPPRGAIRSEDDLVLVGLPIGGLIGGRPDLAGVEVAHEDERAPGVSGDVFAPPGHRQVLAPAVSSAGIGHHHGVRAVREQMDAWTQRVRRDVAPHLQRGQAPRRRNVLRLFNRRILQRNQMGNALVEEQLGRLHTRVRMKAMRHR